MSNTNTLLPLAAGTWTADPNHSNVGFTVRHLGLSKVRGRFEDVTATVVVGPDLASTSVTAEIDMASVSTGNTDRDAHLASSDFFNAEKNPKMTFRSTSIEGSGEEYTLVGDLTLNGITKPVELEVEFFGTLGVPGRPVDPRRVHGDRFAVTQGLRHRVQHGPRWRQGDDLRQGRPRARRPARRPRHLTHLHPTPSPLNPRHLEQMSR